MTYFPPPINNGSSVNTVETTASTTYTDLATVGPSATVVVGPSGTVIVWFGAISERTAINNTAFVSINVSGANTIAASDSNAVLFSNLNYGAGSGNALACPQFRVLTFTGLAPGSTTFKLQYRIDGGTAYIFFNRSIAVTAL